MTVRSFDLRWLPRIVAALVIVPLLVGAAWYSQRLGEQRRYNVEFARAMNATQPYFPDNDVDSASQWDRLSGDTATGYNPSFTADARLTRFERTVAFDQARLDGIAGMTPPGRFAEHHDRFVASVKLALERDKVLRDAALRTKAELATIPEADLPFLRVLLGSWWDACSCSSRIGSEGPGAALSSSKRMHDEVDEVRTPWIRDAYAKALEFDLRQESTEMSALALFSASAVPDWRNLNVG